VFRCKLDPELVICAGNRHFREEVAMKPGNVRVQKICKRATEAIEFIIQLIRPFSGKHTQATEPFGDDKFFTKAKSHSLGHNKPAR